jgi:2-polyprenyl-3-methyl-5-hydroxy-6-metoxy-1,4-benzoquinol methylase
MTGASNYVFKQDRFSSHTQIATQLRGLANRSSTHPFVVLDVGCASGFLRAFLPESDFYLVGIERDPVLLAQAQQTYDEVYAADLNTPLDVELPTPNAIVLADVLEHLPEPEVVLAHLLQRYAKPGTPILISLPNVAHLYVRLSLLLGQFNYTDRGILDRTHLRFFTLKTAKQMLLTCEVRVLSTTVTPVPLPLVHPLFGEKRLLFPVHALSAFLASMFKGLLGFQFILRGVYEP